MSAPGKLRHHRCLLSRLWDLGGSTDKDTTPDLPTRPPSSHLWGLNRKGNKFQVSVTASCDTAVLKLWSRNPLYMQNLEAPKELLFTWVTGVCVP